MGGDQETIADRQLKELYSAHSAKGWEIIIHENKVIGKEIC